ncbi:tumor necrosis factor receptor superfamily member 4 [Labrus mixtus]|uniref:tumor necrosis factor receptor superfamily member 4 n=1 Tax=Labrus mixtus TaxID=508554 RepID=UPI0029BFC39D|nr:tumor necrosis factor receptor superfamily member 4 [Labrus mixtus]
MVLLRWLLLTLIFFELVFNLDARSCPKGHRVVTRKPGCELCPNGFFQPIPNLSKTCRLCTKCDDESGSFVKVDCTRETDRICQCLKGFVFSDSDSSTCKCNEGYGKRHKECSECEDGYFSNQINSPCRKWKKCSAGVNITGTTTSDVVCNDESKTYVTTTSTGHLASLITHVTKKRSHKGAEIQKEDTTRNPLSVTSAPVQRIPPEQKVKPPTPSNTGSYIGIILCLFLIGLLALPAVVICKMYITPCRQRKPAVRTQDSLCRTPVEETVCPLSNSIQESPDEKQATSQLIL